MTDDLMVMEIMCADIGCPEGFDIWQTGGGCLAYGKNIKYGGYILITDDAGGGLPKVGDIFCCTYDGEGHDLDSFQCDNEEQLKKLLEITEELYN